ncbi:tRNA pseudouridine(55) synthase TruB [Dendrosporobacter sp. 1207_IL3150]|uniref:tRNA pseudouridine(55) synthase TruB n=1 Tax=Dendrosporobacter sp. 1207_IL3150 TaxID=3084054 RepID=UPI002FD90D9A
MVNGFINILKPPGMTSHDVVSFIRRTYGMKRVGHAGTLDPAAAGVLPVALGQATRLIEYTTDADKSYRAELTLGFETDTGDDTGQITRKESFILPSRSQIETVLESFIGKSEQVPPMYSAIKIDGKKMYELARAGITVERKPRSIYIEKISLINISQNTILFDVTCSKGTFIRTLCTDIGNKLNIPAVMSFLVRTRVGTFLLDESFTLEEVQNDTTAAILQPDKALLHLPSLSLSEQASKSFCYGQTIPLNEVNQLQLRIYDNNNIFIGIGQLSSGLLSPTKVMSFA